MSIFSFDIRSGKISDVGVIIALAQETILSVNSRDYTTEQITIWSSAIGKKEFWESRFQSQKFWLAENNNGLLGFITLVPDGLIDFLYVHKNFQGKGVANRLMDIAEQEAGSLGIKKLFSEVSITARPFFESRDFKMIREQKKILNGVEFKNFIMTKEL